MDINTAELESQEVNPKSVEDPEAIKKRKAFWARFETGRRFAAGTRVSSGPPPIEDQPLDLADPTPPYEKPEEALAHDEQEEEAAPTHDEQEEAPSHDGDAKAPAHDKQEEAPHDDPKDGETPARCDAQEDALAREAALEQPDAVEEPRPFEESAPDGGLVLGEIFGESADRDKPNQVPPGTGEDDDVLEVEVTKPESLTTAQLQQLLLRRAQHLQRPGEGK